MVDSVKRQGISDLLIINNSKLKQYTDGDLTLDLIVHPVSIKTHWATRSCHASLSKVKCSASSQATPMLFIYWRMISFQFVLGLPGPWLVALISQDIACFGISNIEYLSNIHSQAAPLYNAI